MAIVLILNLPLLLLPHTSGGVVVSVFADALATWFDGVTNTSLLSWIHRAVSLPLWSVAILQVVILLVGLRLIVRYKPTLEYELGALAVLGVLATAVSWPHYMLLVLPFLLLLATDPRVSTQVKAISAATTLPFLIVEPNLFWPISLVVMFGVHVVGSPRVVVRSEPSTPNGPPSLADNQPESI
jgi:hypothetical protein